MHPLVLPCRRDAHNIADSLGDSAAPPDHLAGLIRGHCELIGHRVATDTLFDLDSFRVIDQVLSHILEQRFHRSSVNLSTDITDWATDETEALNTNDDRWNSASTRPINPFWIRSIR